MKLSRQSQYNDMNITEQMLKCYSNKSKFEKLTMSHCNLNYKRENMCLLNFSLLREIYMTNIAALEKLTNIKTNGSIVDKIIKLPPFLEKFTLKFKKSDYSFPLVFEFNKCQPLSYFEISYSKYYFGSIEIRFPDDLTSLKTFIMNGNRGQTLFKFGERPIDWYSKLEKIHVPEDPNWPFLKFVDGKYQLDKEKCPKCTDFGVTFCHYLDYFRPKTPAWIHCF